MNRVQQCRFGGHAQHTVALSLSTGRVRFRTRACSSTASRARIRDGGLRLTTVAGGPTTTGTLILSSFFFSRVCGACRRALRVHALELGKATGAQRDVSGSSAGGIGDPHEGKGAGGASTSRAIPHDVLIWNSPRDPDVSRALSHASNNALLVVLAVQNAALRKVDSQLQSRIRRHVPRPLSILLLCSA